MDEHQKMTMQLISKTEQDEAIWLNILRRAMDGNPIAKEAIEKTQDRINQLLKNEDDHYGSMVAALANLKFGELLSKVGSEI